MTQGTAVATRPSQATGIQAGSLLRPLAKPEEVMAAQNETRELVKQALEKDRDYGIIPGTKKGTLYKAGAERLNAAFGAAATFEVVEAEIDHDRHIQWTKRKKDKETEVWTEVSGESRGLYRYVVCCELVSRATGEVIAQGVGACSTLESKYVDRPRDTENTIVKMAQKRALVAATLIAYGLSDQFADIDDDGGSSGDSKSKRAPKAGPKTSAPSCPKCGGEMWDNRPKGWKPDFRCRDKDNCGHEMNEAVAPPPTPEPTPEGTAPSANPGDDLTDDDLPF